MKCVRRQHYVFAYFQIKNTSTKPQNAVKITLVEKYSLAYFIASL